MTTPAEPIQPRSFVLPALWAAATIVILVAFLFCMLFVVPRFEKEAADQKMKLPFALELTVAVSRWHVKYLPEYWYVVALVTVPICVGMAALVAVIQPEGKLRTGCWILWLVLFGIPALAMAWFVAWQIMTLP